MPRKALIAANWKMFKTPAEAKAFVEAFLPLVAGHSRDEIALFPSPVLLPTVIEAAKGSNVAVGCQNIHFAEEGAYTGETSIGQLKAIGGTHTLIGHSERRQYFAETDEIVNKKLHTALKHGVVPIVCVGEVLAEREAGKTADVLKTQITGAFAGITAAVAAPIVIAYEPVWAIGTGKTATPRSLWMRTRLSARSGQGLARHVGLEVAILAARTHGRDRAHASVELVAPALVKDDLPGASSVPANRLPIMTVWAPAAMAFTRSPEYFIPPSEMMRTSVLASALAQSDTAVT